MTGSPPHCLCWKRAESPLHDWLFENVTRARSGEICWHELQKVWFYQLWSKCYNFVWYQFSLQDKGWVSFITVISVNMMHFHSLVESGFDLFSFRGECKIFIAIQSLNSLHKLCFTECHKPNNAPNISPSLVAIVTFQMCWNIKHAHALIDKCLWNNECI